MTVITKLGQEDEVSIRGIVADIEEGFNSNNPELLAGGPLAEATAHYRLTEISRLAPDAVAAQKIAWSSPQEVNNGAAPQMIALYVFVRRHDRWWISRRQNTELG